MADAPESRRDFGLIEDAAALEDLCARLAGQPWLALDTEFIRERSYKARLCLLQLATPDEIAVVDPLRLPDIDPLLERLYDPACTKVLHAAGQDLEIFHDLRGAVPAPVFDTQIAAAVLGYGDQVGYGALVKAVLGVSLGKDQSRTDWERRPLDPDQLAYAADDVRYLRAIYLRMREDLAARGRSDWLAEDFAALADPGRYRPDPRELWRRIKAGGRLKGAQLAALRELAAWREEQAASQDRPRRWVLRDEALLEIARQLPRDRQRLQRIRGLPQKGLGRHEAAILALVEKARSLPEQEWPRLPEPTRLSDEQAVLLEATAAILHLRAAEQAVTPTTLATRRELERLVAGEGDVPLRHGWRRAIAGADVEAFLRGETRLVVRDGRLTLEPGNGD